MMIRVGIVGYGYSGRTYHVPLIQATPGFQLTMIATSHGDEVKGTCPGVSTVRDPEDLLGSESVDLVVVATPNESHALWARAALDAGKHLVVEKPFTLTLDEARRLTARAEEANRLLAVFHNRRWDSDFLSVSAVIRSGLVGRIAHFESHFDRFRPRVQQRWREQAVAGSGIWYDLAPHLIDQALQLFGLPQAVNANLASLRQEALVDDWAHAVLYYPDRRAIVHASMLVAGGSPRFMIHGDKGSLIKMLPDQHEAQLVARSVPGSSDWGKDPDQLYLWDQTGQCSRIAAESGDQGSFYRALGAAIRGNAPNPVPGHEASAVMAVLDAGLRSSAARRSEPLEFSEAERMAFSRKEVSLGI